MFLLCQVADRVVAAWSECIRDQVVRAAHVIAECIACTECFILAVVSTADFEHDGVGLVGDSAVPKAEV